MNSHVFHTGAVTLALGIAWTSSALAATYGAEATVIHQQCCIASDGRSGPAPTGAGVSGYPDNTFLNSGTARGDANRGQVWGYGGSSSNGGGKTTSIGQANATYDDVMFVWNGPGLGPSTVDVAGLWYSITANQSASGVLGIRGGFNARQVIYSVSFNGSSEGGEVIWDVTGNTGQTSLGAHLLMSAAPVPVGVPVSVSLSLFAGAQASLRLLGSPVNTGINALLAITSSGVGFPPGLGGASASSGDRRQGLLASAEALDFPVFFLPAGFTAFSESMGVVDNRWILLPGDPGGPGTPVPEPGMIVLLAIGLGVGAAVRLRRKRA